MTNYFKAAPVALVLYVNTVLADEAFTGILKLSCEAILCLSSSVVPAACSPSLSHYYNILFDDFSDTIKARINFLEICPVANQSPQMQSLVKAIGNGAGRCDANSLNTTLKEWVPVANQGFGAGFFCINNQLPSYCSAYTNHEYTDLSRLKYVMYPPSEQPNLAFKKDGLDSIRLDKQLLKECGRWVSQ